MPKPARAAARRWPSRRADSRLRRRACGSRSCPAMASSRWVKRLPLAPAWAARHCRQRVACSAFTAPAGMSPAGGVASLAHGLERLVLDRRPRQATDVRRCDHARMACEFGRGHLIGRAADVEGTAGEPAAVERGEQGAVVDQLAARRVHEQRARTHCLDVARRSAFRCGAFSVARQTTKSDSPSSSAKRQGADRTAKVVEGLRRGRPARACRTRARGRRGASPSGRSPITPRVAAAQLAADEGHQRPRRRGRRGRRRRCRGPRSTIWRRPLGDGGDEAGARLSHQHAVRARGGDVDLADVDRAAQEREQLGQSRERALRGQTVCR